jgi:U3 small nucleolar ribonucleoprotein component
MEENPHHDDDDDSLDGSGQRRVHAPRNGKISSVRSHRQEIVNFVSTGGRSCTVINSKGEKYINDMT